MRVKDSKIRQIPDISGSIVIKSPHKIRTFNFVRTEIVDYESLLFI